MALPEVRQDALEQQLEKLFCGFDEQYQKALHVCRFSAATSVFELRSDSDYFVPVIERGLSVTSDWCRPDVRVLAAFYQDSGLPSWCRAAAQMSPLALEAMLRHGRYRVDVNNQYGVCSIYDRELARGIQLSSVPEALPPWDNSSPLRLFIHWRLMDCDRPLMHAGTLAVDGHGILLAGAGGSGKSSTVIAGVCNGLESVGDDYVAVEGCDPVTAYSVFRLMKLNPERLAMMGIKHAEESNWQGKVELSLPGLCADHARSSLQIKALCLPVVSHLKRTQITPISTQQGCLALAPSALYQLPGDRHYLFRMAAKITRKLPVYMIELGTEPAEIAATIESFIRKNCLCH